MGKAASSADWVPIVLSPTSYSSATGRSDPIVRGAVSELLRYQPDEFGGALQLGNELLHEGGCASFVSTSPHEEQTKTRNSANSRYLGTVRIRFIACSQRAQMMKGSLPDSAAMRTGPQRPARRSTCACFCATHNQVKMRISRRLMQLGHTIAISKSRGRSFRACATVGY